MRNAAKPFLVLTLAAAVIGCGNDAAEVDNRSNTMEVNGSVVEVDTLPPDESSATPSEDLANGATEPTAAENSY
jgi:hypothetical protein